MTTAGLSIVMFGAILIALGRLAVFRYGKELGEWPHRMFIGEIKLGFALLAAGLTLVILGVII